MSQYLNKVVKFGGSSLASAEQIRKAASIVKADGSRRYVVVSAPGKRFDSDRKVTDLLVELYELASAGKPFNKQFAEIRERYEEIIKGLELDLDLKEEFDVLKEQAANGASKDYVVSRGEYFSGLIVAAFLHVTFIDASEVVFFDEEGKLEADLTNRVMARRLQRQPAAVIPGFYGSMPDGSVKTFSRGGSDITGAIVARAAKADLYENWTDVSGFLMADPRVVENPRRIDLITYRELRELSYMGASVLHEEAIFPVKVAGIPINIKNTNRPDDKGTFIVASAHDLPQECGAITGIAGKKGLSLLHIEKDMMNNAIGFGARVLSEIADMGLSFEHLPSGIDTMSVVLMASDIAGREGELQDRIARALDPDLLTFETGLALIAVVGRGMAGSPGTAARIFSALGKEEINVRMIDQGSSELNIIVGVHEQDFERAMRAIYGEFSK